MSRNKILTLMRSFVKNCVKVRFLSGGRTGCDSVFGGIERLVKKVKKVEEVLHFVEF